MKPSQTLRALAAMLMLGVFSPAFAAQPMGAADGTPYVDLDPAPGSRILSDAACAEMNEAAAALGKNLQALQGQLLRAFTQTRIEATRELAPLMHRFADRLRDLARQLDQPPAAHDS